MKVVAISGSPRKEGNTARAVEFAMAPLREAGVEVEVISLADKVIWPCTACGNCAKAGKCTAHKDDFQAVFERVVPADGLVLASPVYFGCATASICAFMHRLGYVARAGGNNFLSRKVGGAIAVARRAGHNATFAQLSMFFGINDMIQVGSTYWNVMIGRNVGDVERDEEGIKTMTRFGENLAWILEKIQA
ncbi:MAG: flavodoxin family protein [Planctomycetota bacterium]|nr:flavodoxin family protein [Planctomycetota bacterium]